MPLPMILKRREIGGGAQHCLPSSFSSGSGQRSPLLAPSSLYSRMSRIDLLAAETARLEERRSQIEMAFMRNEVATERILSSLRGTMPDSTVRLLSLLQESGGIRTTNLEPTMMTPALLRKSLDTSSGDKKPFLWSPANQHQLPQLVYVEEREPSVLHDEKDDAIPFYKRQIPEEFPGVSFPSKLFIMLNKAEDDGYSDIVSFLPNGDGFMIHKPKMFAQEIMPRFFKTSRFTSFQKQLSLYGFKRSRHGMDVGAIRHQHFQRDDQKLVAKIQRPKPSRRVQSAMAGDDPQLSTDEEAA